MASKFEEELRRRKASETQGAPDLGGAGVPEKLQMIMDANGGSLPPKLDTWRGEIPDEVLNEFMPQAGPTDKFAAELARRRQQEAPAEPQTKPETNIADDVVRGAADMAAFGFADEIAASADIGSSFLKNLFANGGDVDEALRASQKEMGSYEKQVSKQRATDEAANPTARLVGQIGGAVLTPALGPAKILAGGGGLLKALGTGAVTGLGSGALYGAGAAEEGQRLEGAVGGGMLGAAGGAVAGPAANVASRFVSNAAAKLGGAIKRNPAQRRAISTLAKKLADDEISYEDAMFRIQNMADNDILPDIMGENVRGLAAGAASRPGPAKTRAVEFFTDRAMTQADEAGALVAKTLNTGGEKIADTMGDIVTKQQAVATKLYNAAKQEAADPGFSSALKENKNFQKFMREPVIKRQLNAIFKDRPELRKRMKLDKPIVRPDGSKITSRLQLDTTDYETLHTLHKYLVQASKVAKREGRSYSDEAVDNFRSTLRDFMEGAGAPSYKDAVNAYAGDEASKRAILLGRKIFNTEDFVTNANLKSLSASERRMFTLGAASAIAERAMSSSAPQSAAKTILRSKKITERLRPIFPSDAAFKEFESGIDKLIRQSGTMNRVNPLAGSKTAMTAEEMADSKDVHRFLRDLFLFQSPTMAVGLAGTNAITKIGERISGMQNPGLADILFTPGKKNAQDVMGQMYLDELRKVLAGDASYMLSSGVGKMAGAEAADRNRKENK